MSRIVGIFFTACPRHPRSTLNDMLGASRSVASWTSRSAVSDTIAFGWCGSRSPNLAVVDGVWTVVDGVVYNRAELGNVDSDAELLGMLYLKYGFEDALRKLNGDFAVAIYDAKVRALWLARDRCGVKPLYYVSSSEGFAFASRPRALLVLPGVTRKVNHQFVALFGASHYRYFDNDPEKSPYGDIAQLPAAYMLGVTGTRVTKHAYWSLRECPDFTDPERELAERYRELLFDAVSLRLNSAGRAIFTLSGGLDSSSVLSCAAHVAGERQHAISAVYSDATYDESDDIRNMLGPAVAKWHPVRVDSPDILSVVAQMVDCHDEPVATATWLAHYLLCREARDLEFHSLFGGLGGDELNAGEYEHFFFFFADLYAAGREDELNRETAQWIAHHDHPVFRKSFGSMRDALVRLVDLSRPGRCLPDLGRLGRYASALNADYFSLVDFEPVMDHVFSSYLKNRTCQDLFRETIPCCLRAADRNATAFGLETIFPFFDHRLVEFMFRVPGTLKIRNGLTKHLLREAMREILPEETRARIKKTGWNAPAHVWFSGKGRDLLMDLVDSQAFRERGIYNLVRVRRLIDEHDQIISSGAQRENHMMLLWQLVNLELWFRSFID